MLSNAVEHIRAGNERRRRRPISEGFFLKDIFSAFLRYLNYHSEQRYM
jgi:hypothetical protein